MSLRRRYVFFLIWWNYSFLYNSYTADGLKFFVVVVFSSTYFLFKYISSFLSSRYDHSCRVAFSGTRYVLRPLKALDVRENTAANELKKSNYFNTLSGMINTS